MTKPQASRADIFKIKVMKKSPDRVFWGKGKAAVEKKIDLKIKRLEKVETTQLRLVG